MALNPGTTHCNPSGTAPWQGSKSTRKAAHPAPACDKRQRADARPHTAV